MCRVRFGLTDIHFDECRPSLPRESYYQPLVVAIPSTVEKRQGKSGSRLIARGVTVKKDVVGATPNVGITRSYKKSRNSGVKAFDGSARSSSSLSSLLRDDDGSKSTGTRVKPKAPSTGVKRPRTLSSSSSSLSDENWPHKPTKNATRQSVTTPAVLPKLASPTKTKCNIKCTKASALKTTKKSSKAPSTKKVRFVMDMGDATIPHHPVSDTSSSHSSDVSYTDPPSPVEPYDAYSGYYRAPGASRTHGNKYNTASLLARWQREEDFGTDWLFDSEEGSAVDVQHLPVKNTPLKLMHYNGIRLRSDRMHPNISLAPLKRPGRGPQGMAWDLESEMMDRRHCAGLQPMESHLQRRESVMSRHPVEGPKRSGKKVLEPTTARLNSYTEREHDRKLIPERHQASEKAKRKAKREAKTYLPPRAVTEDIEDDRQWSTP